MRVWILKTGLLFCIPPWTIAGQSDSLTAVITPLTQNIFVHTSFKRLGISPYPSNGLIVSTTAGAILVDNGWDSLQSHQIVEWIRKNLNQAVVLCIVTHAHDDRFGGYKVLVNEQVPIWSSKRTFTLARIPELVGILPNDTLFQIGGEQFVIHFPGAGHTKDNIVVWLPNHGVLFGGCLIKSTETTGLGNVADADLSSWPRAIEDLIGRYPDARWVIPGHQGWSGIDALHHTIDLLRNR